jgi:hypothetical protein
MEGSDRCFDFVRNLIRAELRLLHGGLRFGHRLGRLFLQLGEIVVAILVVGGGGVPQAARRLHAAERGQRHRPFGALDGDGAGARRLEEGRRAGAAGEDRLLVRIMIGVDGDRYEALGAEPGAAVVLVAAAGEDDRFVVARVVIDEDFAVVPRAQVEGTDLGRRVQREPVGRGGGNARPPQERRAGDGYTADEHDRQKRPRTVCNQGLPQHHRNPPSSIVRRNRARPSPYSADVLPTVVRGERAPRTGVYAHSFDALASRPPRCRCAHIRTYRCSYASSHVAAH